MSQIDWKKTNTFKLLIVVIIAWIVLAVIFGLTDLEISKAVVDDTLLWAKIGQTYGEPPGHVFWAICLVVLLGLFIGKDDIKKQKKIGWIMIIILFLAFIVGIVINEEDLIIYGSFIGVGLCLFMFFTKDKDWEPFRVFALVVILLALINPAIFVQGIKLIAGRVRFRDLTAPLYPEYTPWFIFRGYTDNKSFPSGHTAMGWMLLPLLILVRNREWKDPVRIILTVGVIGWGFFVGLSRIALGAHYASDVLFSTCTAFIITIILYKIFYFDKER